MVLEVCKSQNLKILNGRKHGDSLGKPTFHGFNGVSVVDYIIVSPNIFDITSYFVVKQPTYLSDHSQLIAWFSVTKLLSNNHANTYQQNNLTRIPNQFIWDLESKQKFQSALLSSDSAKLVSEFLSSDFSSNELGVKTALSKFEKILITAAKQSLRLKNKKTSRKRFSNVLRKKWFDKECNLHRIKLRRLSNAKHRDPSNISIRTDYHTCLREYKVVLRHKKDIFQSNILKKIEKENDSTKFWKTLRSSNDSLITNEVPPISEQQWLNHFRTLHADVDLDNNQFEIKNEFKSLENQSRYLNELDFHITEKELISCAKSLKFKKACGRDKISNEMIKSSIDILCPAFIKLFNIILQSGIFPESWSLSTITPIFKSGSNSKPENYRGICVFSCLGKFFCTILNTRLLKYYDKKNIIHPSQIGFRHNSRTNDHIFTLRTLIDKYVHATKKGKIYACFIDFKKAFDSIWHTGLLYKLLKIGVGNNFYNIIKDMYSKTRCNVKLGTHCTNSFDYKRGVRQGCVLSPALFNLYLNQLPQILEHSDVDPFVLPNGTKLSCLLYADDLVLLSHSQQGLQVALNKLAEFRNTWKMNINHKKTKVMIFQKTPRKSCNPCFTLNDNQIEKTDDYTYLGIKISSNGNFNLAEICLKDKAMKALFSAKRLINFSLLTPKYAEKIFDTLIRPIVLYGSEVWGAYSKDDYGSWDKSAAEKLHIRFCKLYLGVNSKSSNDACRAELGRLPLKMFVDKQIIKYYCHLNELDDNTIAKQALEMSTSLSALRKKCFKSYYDGLLQKHNYQGNSISSKANTDKIFNKMKEHYLLFWENKIRNSTKLEFFRTQNPNYNQAKYLSFVKQFKFRQLLTKLRISSHSLMIETGRYHSPKIPKELRLCKLCKKSKIENEEHFLFDCEMYEVLRRDFLAKCNNKIKSFKNISDFKTLLDSDDEFIHVEIAKFIYNLNDYRNNVLT